MLYGGTVLSTRNARQAVGIAKLLNRDVAIVGPLRSTSMDAVGDVLFVCGLYKFTYSELSVLLVEWVCRSSSLFVDPLIDIIT